METRADIFSTFKAPCNKTQNEGVFPSSTISSSLVRSISTSTPLAFIECRMRCRLTAIGEPISATGMKPRTCIVSHTVKVWQSKSVTFV